MFAQLISQLGRQNGVSSKIFRKICTAGEAMSTQSPGEKKQLFICVKTVVSKDKQA